MKNLIFFLLAISICSCNDDEPECLPYSEFQGPAEHTIDSIVSFKLSVLDENMQETNVFNEGDYIIYSFVITNLVDYDLCLMHGYLKEEDFFKTVQTTNGCDIYMGTNSEGFLITKELCKYISPGESLVIQSAWPCNDELSTHYYGCQTDYFLPKGDYKVEFNSSFYFIIYNKDNLETDTLHFGIKFKVE